jgi:hypothetical protein
VEEQPAKRGGRKGSGATAAAKGGGRKRKAAEEEAEEAEEEAEAEEEEEEAAPARKRRRKNGGGEEASKGTAGRRSGTRGKRPAAEEEEEEEAEAEEGEEGGEEIDWAERVAFAPRQVSVSMSKETELRETVLGAIRGLGGVRHKACEEAQLGPLVSHLIVGDTVPVKRTAKFLFAMAKGVPVVHAQWVVDSVMAGKWLEATTHLATPLNPYATRQLAGKSVCVRSTEPGVDRAMLEELVLAAGGTLAPRRSATHIISARPDLEEAAEGGGQASPAPVTTTLPASACRYPPPCCAAHSV